MLPGVCDKVTSEVMALHERLMVEVRDNSVLHIATNIEHLNRTSISKVNLYSIQ